MPLENSMGVGAAKAEVVDRRATDTIFQRPILDTRGKKLLNINLSQLRRDED